MRKLAGFLTIAVIGCVIPWMTVVEAQPPGRPEGGRGGAGRGGDATSYITRMMSFDANQDGKLARDEITDARLTALFDRADADHDGIVTKDELTADFNAESAKLGPEAPGGPGGPGFPGPGGPGGPGGRGFGGPGGPGGPPPLGQVLPQHVQGMLRLTKAQKTKLAALQKLVDTKLAEILTDEQKREFEEMKTRGPGGPGGPDGNREGFGPPPGGPGGPGGNRGPDAGPPGERGRPRRPSDN